MIEELKALRGKRGVTYRRACSFFIADHGDAIIAQAEALELAREGLAGLTERPERCEQLMSLPPKCIRAYRAREALTRIDTILGEGK